MAMHRRRTWVTCVASILILPLMLLVAACGVTTTGVGGQATVTAATTTQATAQATTKATAQTTPRATPHATQSAPQTRKPVNCAAILPEMAGAQEVVIPNTDFPGSGAAIVAVTSSNTSLLQVVQYTACIQVFLAGTVGHISVAIISDTSSPTAEVVAALHLQDRGWRLASRFPFDGTNMQPCVEPQRCYTTDGAAYFLELEQVRDRSNGVLTFVLRVTSPKPLVACDPALFAVDYYPGSTAVEANAEFPLPPTTKVSGGYGDSQGITTYFCSDGTAASITSFMDTHLPEWGWSSLTVAGQRLWKFDSGVGPVYMRIYPITDPLKWAILTYNQGANFG